MARLKITFLYSLFKSDLFELLSNKNIRKNRFGYFYFEAVLGFFDK